MMMRTSRAVFGVFKWALKRCLSTTEAWEESFGAVNIKWSMTVRPISHLKCKLILADYLGETCHFPNSHRVFPWWQNLRATYQVRCNKVSWRCLLGEHFLLTTRLTHVNVVEPFPFFIQKEQWNYPAALGSVNLQQNSTLFLCKRAL